MERGNANPFTRMGQLDRRGAAYTVTVTTMAHQLFKEWGVLTWDEDWLVLQAPGDDEPAHVPIHMITSIKVTPLP